MTQRHQLIELLGNCTVKEFPFKNEMEAITRLFNALNKVSKKQPDATDNLQPKLELVFKPVEKYTEHLPEDLAKPGKKGIKAGTVFKIRDELEQSGRSVGPKLNNQEIVKYPVTLSDLEVDLAEETSWLITIEDLQKIEEYYKAYKELFDTVPIYPKVGKTMSQSFKNRNLIRSEKLEVMRHWLIALYPTKYKAPEKEVS